MKITTRSAALADVGRQRAHQEDGFLADTEVDLYAVLDGMGGGSSGDIATKTAIDALREGFRASPDRGAAGLASAVQLANRRIFDLSQGKMKNWGLGAAVAAMAVSQGPDGATVHVAHVGDSRAYRFRRLELEPLTRDHSLINEYRSFKPDLTPEEVAALPKNVITRALGVKADVEVAESSHAARAGDLYLLCTDGIHGELDDAEIAHVLRAHIDVKVAAEGLVQAALDHGGKDNIACVVVQLGLG